MYSFSEEPKTRPHRQVKSAHAKKQSDYSSNFMDAAIRNDFIKESLTFCGCLFGAGAMGFLIVYAIIGMMVMA